MVKRGVNQQKARGSGSKQKERTGKQRNRGVKIKNRQAGAGPALAMSQHAQVAREANKTAPQAAARLQVQSQIGKICQCTTQNNQAPVNYITDFFSRTKCNPSTPAIVGLIKAKCLYKHSNQSPLLSKKILPMWQSRFRLVEICKLDAAACLLVKRCKDHDRIVPAKSKRVGNACIGNNTKNQLQLNYLN